MEDLQEAKKVIKEVNNIGILPSKEKKESIPLSLALLYSLNKLNKNVNLLLGEVPKDFQFLLPSSNSISPPKKFVLSVKKPQNTEVSRVFYENKNDSLNFHITTKKGVLKKNGVSFQISPKKNDLLIIVGIDGFLKKENRIPEETRILNINNKNSKNNNFINIIEDSSLSKTVFNLLNNIEIEINENIATCVLAGLIFSTNNFQQSKTSSESFKVASKLKEKGASHKKIVNHLYKS